VVALREPFGLPSGLPDFPFWKGFPRCFPAVFSDSDIGLAIRAVLDNQPKIFVDAVLVEIMAT
jgi:hypothetical protein